MSLKIVQGLGLAILLLLLFLSLSVFGIVFTLNSTLLNPDFVTSQVDEIDVSVLVRDLTEPQIGEHLPQEALFVKEAIYDIVDEQEPWLKEQLNATIHAGYAYLLGKSDRLDITISLKALKAGLRDTLWQTFSDAYLSDFSNLPEDQVKAFIDQHFEEIIDKIPEQYLRSGILMLPEEEVKQFLKDNYRILLENIPEEYLQQALRPLLEVYLQAYFDQFYQEFIGQVPDEYTLDEGSIPPEAMVLVMMARQYISYFQTGYYALIAFMVLLIAAIILINRNVRDTTRELGIAFLVYGAVEFVGVYFARKFIPESLPLHEVPPSVQTWAAGLVGDMLTPLQMFSLGVLIGGVVLLAVSFIYRPAMSED